MRVSDYAETLRLTGLTPEEDDFYAAGFTEDDLKEAGWFQTTTTQTLTSDASLESYDPTIRDNMRVGIQEKLKGYGLDDNLSSQIAYNLAGSRNPTDGTGGGGALDFTPVGIATGVQEGFRDARRGLSSGDYAQAGLGVAEAGLNVLGALPGAKAAYRGVGKVSDKLMEQYDPTVVRTFFGPTSPKADLTALKEAEHMSARGEEAKRIWEETGWWKGPNGWRFEVDDSQLKIPTEGRGANRDLYDHPDFWEALDSPDKEFGTGIIAREAPEEGLHGQYNPKTNSVEVYGGDVGFNKSTAVHELQHVIQDVGNDLGRGANPTYIKNLVERNLESLGPAGSRATKGLMDVGSIDEARLLAESSGDFEQAEKLGKKVEEKLGHLRNDLDEAGFFTDEDLESALNLGRQFPSYEGMFDRKGLREDVAMSLYQKESGEVEARIAGSRANMDPISRRYTLPSENMDVSDHYTIKGLDDWFYNLDNKRYEHESSRSNQR